MRRMKISFDSSHIGKRLQACQAVAQASGWHPNDIINFTDEVRDAFSYEEAMAVIAREFDVIP
jgi:hypothetical protein